MRIKDDYAKIIWKRTRERAKKANIDFDLTLLDVMYMTVPITCPALGIPIRMENGRATDNSLSIDRIDSSKGYTVDNCIFVSWRANRLKNNATLEELKMISNYYSLLHEELTIIENQS